MQTVPDKSAALCQSFRETATMSCPSSGCQAGSSSRRVTPGQMTIAPSARSVSPFSLRLHPCPFPR